MSLKLNLLTNPLIETVGGNQLIPADKRGALLVYLACSKDWLQREQVSFLFWPDKDDKTARRNLRQLISRSKKLSFVENIELDDHNLKWSVSLDTSQFKKAIAEQNWQQAVELYQGDFCKGFTIADANGFQDWLELEREAYTSAFSRAVRQHSESLLQQGNYKQAAELLKLVLQQNELAEDIVQRYLQAAYLAGQRDEALAYYRQFSEQLKTELELEPLEETQNIVKTIEQSQALSIQDNKDKTVTSSQVVPLSVMRPPKLVGRQKSIEQLQSSGATLIVLMGEAGIGKTRLMAELAPSALLIKAEESLNTIPFHAITEFIKSRDEHPREQLGVYVNDIVRLIPEIDPQLKPGPTEVLTAKQRLLEALVRYIEAISLADDFGIAFDDIQWLDESSIELLCLLNNRGNVRLIATCRKYETPNYLTENLNALKSIDYINLEALGLEDIQTLLAELMGRDVKPLLFAKWLHQNTSGNIMFVLETLKSLFESGDLRADQEGWHSNLDDITNDYSELVIPKLVSELIQRRVEPLDQEVKRVLQGAAVIGQDFDGKILSQITGLSQWSILEALEVGQAIGVLAENDFKHDILRESIYSNLTPNKKSFLHARVAETLDSSTSTNANKDDLLIAQHWLTAQEEEKAARVILRAVRQQRSIGLQAEAIHNLERCIDLDLDQDLRHEIEYLLSILLIEIGQLDKATTLLETLLQQSSSPERQAKILCGQISIGLRQGDDKRVEDAFIQLQKLETGIELPLDVRQEILFNKAEMAHYKGAYEDAVVLISEFIDLCRKDGDDFKLAQGIGSLGVFYDYLKRYDEALSTYNECLRICKRINASYLQQEVALNIVSCYTDLGRNEEAIKVGVNALSLGRYDTTDHLRNNLAVAYLNVEQHEQAIEQFECLINETENNALTCNAWAYLIRLYAMQKQKDKQKIALEQALKFTQKTDSNQAIGRVIVSCLIHGNAEDQKAARALVDDLDMDAIPPLARAELEQSLKNT